MLVAAIATEQIAVGATDFGASFDHGSFRLAAGEMSTENFNFGEFYFKLVGVKSARKSFKS